MTLSPAIGSQSLPALLQRAGSRMRLDVHKHSLELATGQAADPSRRLRGNVGPLVLIDSRLQRIAARETVQRSVADLFGTAQTALDKLAGMAGASRDRLINVAGLDASSEALTQAGDTARAGLAGMISALSVAVAGRTVFSGGATDRGPLPDTDSLLAAVRSHLAGAVTADDVIAGIEDFFDTPGGAFESAIYAGAASITPADTALGVVAAPLPTAADPAIRGMLREAVLAAMLAEPAVIADLGQRRELALRAVGRQAEATGQLVALRGTLGETEARLDESLIRLGQERDTLLRSRDALIGVDAFEAASRLEETRARLEALYMVTARVARLSLTEYLR